MSDLPWQSVAEQALDSTLLRKTQLGGGDFAESYQAFLSNGECVFIKTHRNPPAHFFSTEAAGLQWLSESGCVNVPTVLAVSDSPPLLVLEWIETSGSNPEREAEFGRELAALHQSPFTVFGRPDHRTTGSQAMPNKPCSSWSDFYASQRLLPLARIASDTQTLPAKTINMLESVANRLSEIAPESTVPSLLHGDLWAGNRVLDHTGKSWLIDPAAHGGHREFDLAMLRLFGGYGTACFDAYHDVFPLEAEWQTRIALHQLAPLVVHAIKFGASYRSATQRALESYC